MATVFFTHIQKTAGTSVRKAIFNKIVSNSDIKDYRGIQAAFKDYNKSFKFLKGHSHTGCISSIMFRNTSIMLRDPIERAISYYDFVKACDGENYKHPNLRDVKENSLLEFYSKCKYQNVQTRFIAGFGWNYIGETLAIKGPFGRWMLKIAKQNLIHRYDAFGLKEYLPDTIQIFASRLNVSAKIPEKQYKKTPQRPDLKDINRKTIEALKEANSLDLELYRYAVNEFEKQLN